MKTTNYSADVKSQIRLVMGAIVETSPHDKHVYDAISDGRHHFELQLEEARWANPISLGDHIAVVACMLSGRDAKRHLPALANRHQALKNLRDFKIETATAYKVAARAVKASQNLAVPQL